MHALFFFDPYFNGVTSFEQVDLNTLLHEADVVSLHGRLTEETTDDWGKRTNANETNDDSH